MLDSQSPLTVTARKSEIGKNRSLRRATIAAAGLCLFALASLISVLTATGSGEKTTVVIIPKERETMNAPLQAGTQPREIIPPIDASAPAHTETATFAMG